MPMKKILLVDDIAIFVDKEKSILSRADFKIYTATSGEEALEIHKAENMDMIVTDLDMPGISGDKLCSIIRQDDRLKHVSVIIVCNNSATDLARIARCQTNAYITKPIRPVEFLEKVSKLLDIPERQSYRVLLKVKIKGKSKAEAFFCTSQNISVTGLLIESDKILEKGDIISCSFFLPKSECIVADAEVMRVVKKENNVCQYGVRYLDINPKFRGAIDSFIKSKSGKK
jgi:CheY-like chemotaxis protein